MNSLTKAHAKEKAEILKNELAKFDHEVKIRHCYEVIAKQSGYEDWNSMSAHLDKPVGVGTDMLNPGSGNRDSVALSAKINPTKSFGNMAYHEEIDRHAGAIGEGEKVYEFEVMANAKVKRHFEVRGVHSGHAYSNLEKHIKENEAEFFSGEDWEVEGNIGQTQYWDIDLSYSSGLHKERNLAPVTIYSHEKEEVETQNEEGISWQSVQQES